MTPETLNAETLNARLASGGVVQVTTYGASFLYTPKNAGDFKDGKDGLYVRRGKRWDYLGKPGMWHARIRMGYYA